MTSLLVPKSEVLQNVPNKFWHAHFPCHAASGTTITDQTGQESNITVGGTTGNIFSNRGYFTSAGDHGATFTQATALEIMRQLRFDSDWLSPGEVRTVVVSFRAIQPDAVSGVGQLFSIGTGGTENYYIYWAYEGGNNRYRVAVFDRENALIRNSDSPSVNAREHVVTLAYRLRAEARNNAYSLVSYVDREVGALTENEVFRPPLSLAIGQGGEIGTLWGLCNALGNVTSSWQGTNRVGDIRITVVADDVFDEIGEYADQAGVGDDGAASWGRDGMEMPRILLDWRKRYLPAEVAVR